MSGPYFFGPVRQRVSLQDAQRADKIARAHGATFVGPVTLPGNPLRGWFEAPNRGAPFDDATRDAVLADVESAGLKLFKDGVSS